MADRSKIEWADASWNPVRARCWQVQDDGSGKERIGWHCEHVSEACRNCYAESFNMRLGTGFEYKPGNLRGKPGYHGGGIDRPEIFLDEKMLLKPLQWKRPRKIFVGSMTDLFADFVTDEMLDKIFAVAALCPQHTFQFLTKRPARMRSYINSRLSARPWEKDGSPSLAAHPHYYATTAKPGWPLPNVWLGTSCEDQATADERILDLLATPAAVRFVSAEPMLGPINLEQLGTLAGIRESMPGVVEREERGRPASGAGSICGAQIDAVGSPGSSITFFQTPDHMGGFIAISPRQWPRLDWVICGGESGPHARPMHPDWARALRDQCATAGVAFHFKQWGEWKDGSDFGADAKAVLKDGRVIEPTTAAMSEADRDRPVPPQNPTMMRRVGKRRAGRLLDGIEHNAFPEANL